MQLIHLWCTCDCSWRHCALFSLLSPSQAARCAELEESVRSRPQEHGDLAEAQAAVAKVQTELEEHRAEVAQCKALAEAAVGAKVKAEAEATQLKAEVAKLSAGIEAKAVEVSMEASRVEFETAVKRADKAEAGNKKLVERLTASVVHDS